MSDPQLPPLDELAEKAVLGAAITDKHAYDIAAAKITGSDFWYKKHEFIWDAIAGIKARGGAVDFVTVQSELDARNILDEVGGVAYLTDIIGSVHRAENLDTYAETVRRHSIRRAVMGAANKAMAKAQNIAEDFDELLGFWDQSAVAFRQRTGRKQPTWGELLTTQYDRVQYRMEHPDTRIGIPTGFRDLDNLLIGLQAPQLVILGARPGTGKTSLQLNVATNAAKMKQRVGFFSLEMTGDQIADRIMSSESGIPTPALRRGTIDTAQYNRLLESGRRLHKLNDHIFIDDTPAVTAEYVKSKALQWQHEHGLDLIVVDYLQLMTDSMEGQRKNGTREQEVSSITRKLKNIAKSLNVPVFCAAQLNRELGKRNDKRPVLSDLRESGEMEQTADVVVFLHREVMYDETADPNGAELIVAKNREGPTGNVPLYFDAETTQFRNATREHVNLGG